MKDVPKQFLSFVCPVCETKASGQFGHYDVMRCPRLGCLASVWALQPKKDGPLVLFPWRGRYNAATEVRR